jgi:hypothetical protein
VQAAGSSLSQCTKGDILRLLKEDALRIVRSTFPQTIGHLRDLLDSQLFARNAEASESSDTSHDAIKKVRCPIHCIRGNLLFYVTITIMCHNQMKVTRFLQQRKY